MIAGLWWLSCAKEAAAFWWASGRARESQRRTLARIIRGAMESEFGKAHGFGSIRDVDDFRQRVAVSDYEDYREAIGRIASGHRKVLSDEPVRLFEPTSGTRGGAKLIPYTTSLKAEFQRGLAPWIFDLLGRRPGLRAGRHYWSISPPAARQTRLGGIPVGFEDDAAYLTGVGSWLVRSLMAVPPSVLQSADYQGATLRCLLDCPDLTLVSVWSPTFWLLLMERLGDRDLRSIWPRLQCLSCWGDGYSERYLEPLRQLHPGVLIQKKGLLATEAFCTFPLIGKTGSALSLRSHFFEFLAEGRSMLAHQLDVGRIYELVVTTGGGLYRYRLGDRVRVEGYYRDCPLLSFQGRSGVVDRFGEKLCEEDVLDGLPSQGLAMLAYESSRQGYALLAEGELARLLDCVRQLELQLCQRNFHYQNCRTLGQLRALSLYWLRPGALPVLIERLGIRAGDFKPQPLRAESDWSAHLPGEFIDSP